MRNNDCLCSDIQNLCNAVSDWLIQKINNPIETTETPVPVVTSRVITAEPVKIESVSAWHASGPVRSPRPSHSFVETWS